MNTTAYGYTKGSRKPPSLQDISAAVAASTLFFRVTTSFVTPVSAIIQHHPDREDEWTLIYNWRRPSGKITQGKFTSVMLPYFWSYFDIKEPTDAT